MSAYCYQCRKTWCICRTLEQEEAWAAEERERAEEAAMLYAEAARLGLDPMTWKPYEPGLLDENLARERLEQLEQARRDARED